MQKKKNNVARSRWKFLKFNKKEIYKYVNEFKLLREKQGMQKFGLVKNNIIINNINYMYTYYFNLGNSFFKKKFSPFCISWSSLSVLKFKKPFSFRPKKKKK